MYHNSESNFSQVLCNNSILNWCRVLRLHSGKFTVYFIRYIILGTALSPCATKTPCF